LPSEKSWSAGSMVAGGSRGNSKSGSGSDPRGESQGGRSRKVVSGEIAMLLTQAEAIVRGSCNGVFVFERSCRMNEESSEEEEESVLVQVKVKVSNGGWQKKTHI